MQKVLRCWIHYFVILKTNTNHMTLNETVFQFGITGVTYACVTAETHMTAIRITSLRHRLNMKANVRGGHLVR